MRKERLQRQREQLVSIRARLRGRAMRWRGSAIAVSMGFQSAPA
jgi:hypothetical protein